MLQEQYIWKRICKLQNHLLCGVWNQHVHAILPVSSRDAVATYWLLQIAELAHAARTCDCKLELFQKVKGRVLIQSEHKWLTSAECPISVALNLYISDDMTFQFYVNYSLWKDSEIISGSREKERRKQTPMKLSGAKKRLYVR